jgi:hypothetical protein
MTPRHYQIPSIETLTAVLQRGGAALDGSDTGTGKTYVALEAARRAGRPVFIVAPKSVLHSWKATAEAVGVSVVWFGNVEKLKRSGWVRRLPGKNRWQWANLNGAAVVVDEVHRFSASNSQNAVILAAAPKPVLMLSATAFENPLKMRATGHQLGLTTWNDWWTWCGRNGCRRAFFGGLEFKGGQAVLDRLHKQIYTTGRGVRVRIKDIPNFPKVSYETVFVPVDNQRAIDEAYAAELEAKAEESTGAVKFLRARQLSEHGKISAACEIAEDLLQSGNSVVFFVNFRETLDQIAKQFPDAGLVYGGQNDRPEQVARFSRDETRIAASMLQAGGVGLDGLQDLRGEFPRVGLLFPDCSAVNVRQAFGRLPRDNARSASIYKILLAEDTVEEENIAPKLEKKLHNIDTLNDGDFEP